MSQQSDSSKDPICPTYAAGTFAKMSTNGGGDILNDYYSQNTSITGSTQSNGYINEFSYSRTVGAFNNDWNNSYLTQSVTPTYSSGLLSFGNTGLQS